MMLGKLDIHMYKTETRHLSLSLYKINSKWINNLNVRPETLQINIGKTLRNRGLGKDFPNRTPIAQEITARIDK
jgi:hypothetical protein